MEPIKKKPSPAKFAVVFTSSFIIGYLMFAVVFAGPQFLRAFFIDPIGYGTSTEVPAQQTGEPQFFPTIANDLSSIGSMNHQYLQGHTFKQVLIEIDRAESAHPEDVAINGLRDVIEQYADKPEGVLIEMSDVIEDDDDEYTLGEIQRTMRAYRDNYSTGDTAVIYILYLNGEFADINNTLGVTVNASSFVMFPEEVQRSSGANLFGGPAYERSIVVHEFGHLLGLVNVNYESAAEREDPIHPGHSNNPASVMYWAVESFNVQNLFRGGPPANFDEADEFDIEQIKAGIY